LQQERQHRVNSIPDSLFATKLAAGQLWGPNPRSVVMDSMRVAIHRMKLRRKPAQIVKQPESSRQDARQPLGLILVMGLTRTTRRLTFHRRRRSLLPVLVMHRNFRKMPWKLLLF
jgi:hypothetical protein